MITGHRPRLTVDLRAIADNWYALAKLAPAAECSAVCKANAYGLGAREVAPILQLAGARIFFVATTEEGLELREALGKEPAIYVLNGASEAEFPVFRKHGLLPVLCTGRQVMNAIQFASGTSAPVTCALHIDTGMNRLGLSATELPDFFDSDERIRLLDVRLVLSHLACADPPGDPMNDEQADRFDQILPNLIRLFPSALKSLSSTGGILLGSRFAYDLVRPGIGLYGGLPFAGALPVVRLEAPILQVRNIKKGETVGYGATWEAERPSTIATIPIGYSDGVFRRLTEGGRARIRDQIVPFVGRVNMDLITLDVTDVPGVALGEAVELLGTKTGVNEIAELAGTIPNEVLTCLRGRYERRYIGRASNNRKET